MRRKHGHEHLLSSRTAIFTQTDAVDPGEELYQKVRAAQGWSKSQRVKAPVAAPPADMTAAPGAASAVSLDTSLDAAGSDSDSNSEEEESDQEEEEEERDPGVDSFLRRTYLRARF